MAWMKPKGNPLLISYPEMMERSELVSLHLPESPPFPIPPPCSGDRQTIHARVPEFIKIFLKNKFSAARSRIAQTGRCLQANVPRKIKIPRYIFFSWITSQLLSGCSGGSLDTKYIEMISGDNKRSKFPNDAFLHDER